MVTTATATGLRPKLRNQTLAPLMKTYAQFYRLSPTTNELIEACGDRSIIRLDGRQSQSAHEHLAEQECRNRGYIAWQLIKGESLLRAKPVTRVSPLYY